LKERVAWILGFSGVFISSGFLSGGKNALNEYLGGASDP
jgi:hypothetical protein